MYSKSLLFVSLLSLSSRVLCEELSEADVPAACASICQPIVQLTAICDTDAHGQTLKRRQNTNSPGHQCVCQNTSFNVAQIAALCASCLQQNNGKTTEMNRIVSACGFPAQTFAASLASIAATINVQATRPTQAFSAPPLSATNAAAAPSGAAQGNGNGGPIALSTPNLSAIGAAIQTLSISGISSFATQTESRITVSMSFMTVVATNAAAAGLATDSTGTVTGATTTGTAPAQQTKNAAAPRAVSWGLSGLMAGAVVFGML